MKYIHNFKKKCMKTAFLLLIVLFSFSLHCTSANAAVKISNNSIYLTKGESYKLKVSGTKSKVKWSSSNKKIATVTSSGKVSGKSIGNTIVTAKVGKKSYKCKVYVVQTIASVDIFASNYYVELKIKNTSNYTISAPDRVYAYGYSYTGIDDYIGYFVATSNVKIKPGKTCTVSYNQSKLMQSEYNEYIEPDVDTLVYTIMSGGKKYKFKSKYGTDEYGYEYDWLNYVNGKRISPIINSPYMTYSEFKKIKNGMTYKQVCDIVGGKGNLRSQSRNIKIYEWISDESDYGWATVTFKNGKVYRKSQYL